MFSSAEEARWWEWRWRGEDGYCCTPTWSRRIAWWMAARLDLNGEVAGSCWSMWRGSRRSLMWSCVSRTNRDAVLLCSSKPNNARASCRCYFFSLFSLSLYICVVWSLYCFKRSELIWIKNGFVTLNCSVSFTGPTSTTCPFCSSSAGCSFQEGGVR